jgi:excisionase family DNA binding protein
MALDRPSTNETKPVDRGSRSGAMRRRLTRADVMTAAEVGAMLGLPKSTVYDLARRGELPCARLGRTLRFVRDDIEDRLRGPAATG